MTFEKHFDVRWADLDPNWHLRHSVYADFCAQVRFAFLAENGFDAARFAHLGMGPVLFREELLYLKEIRALDRIRVDLRVAGAAPDGSRWRLVHEIFRPDGKRAARVTVEGAWLDQRSRKLIRPPADLVETLGELLRSDDWESLPAIGSVSEDQDS